MKDLEQLAEQFEEICTRRQITEEEQEILMETIMRLCLNKFADFMGQKGPLYQQFQVMAREEIAKTFKAIDEN